MKVTGTTVDKDKKAKDAKPAAKPTAKRATRARLPKISGDKLRRAFDLLSLVPSDKGEAPSVFVGMKSVQGGVQLSLSSILSVTARVDCELEIPEGRAVDRRLLFPFVKSGGEYSMKYADDKLIVQQGRRRAAILTVPVEWSYGDWESVEKEAMQVALPDGFADMLAAGKLCASTETSVPRLNAVYAEIGEGGMLTMASNNMILGQASKVAASDPPPDEKPAKKGKKGKKGKKQKAASVAGDPLVFSVAMVDPLIKEKIGEIMVSDRMMGFAADGARVWGQSPEEAWTKFPKDKMEQLLADGRESPVVLTCATKDLAAVCKEFAGYLGNVKSDEWDLEIRSEKGKAHVQAKTAYGDFEDDLKAEIGDDASVSVNLSMLSPVVDFLSSREDSVQISASEAFCAIRAGVYEFLLSRKGS